MKKYNSFPIRAFLLTMATIALIGCQPSAVETKEVNLTALTSLDRAGQYGAISGTPQVGIKAAKNEYESFQVVVQALSKPVRVVNAALTDLKGDAGSISKDNFTFYRPEYARIRRSSPRAQLPPGLYPDPLVPFINPSTGEPIEPMRQIREQWHDPVVTKGYEMYALPFDLWKGQNQPLWVDVFIPAETPAGEYKGVFSVTLDDFPEAWGNERDSIVNKVISIPVSLTVWDFAIPEQASHRNHFGPIEGITERFDVEADSKEYREIEMNYCKIYAQHRLNAPFPKYFLPEMKQDGSLNIIPEKHASLKEFIKTMKIADFEIPRAPMKGMYTPNGELTAAEKEKCFRYYRDYNNYVKENGWEKRAYVYLYDEPNTTEDYQRVRELSAVIHEAAPGLQVLVVEQPYTQDPSWPDIKGSVDIWCPLFGFIDRNAVNEVISKGNEVWSYTALSQRAPKYHPHYEEVKDYDSPYWHMDATMASHRTPTWMNYQYNIKGILYWSLTTRVLDNWNAPTFSHFGSHFNGGGYFIYPGLPCGINGPVASIRLKNLRESMEDYEYLAIYEKLAGREAVLKAISKVAPEWWSTTDDPAAIFSAREFIANEIVKLKKQ